MDDERQGEQMYREMMLYAATIAHAASRALPGQIVRVDFSDDLRYLDARAVPGDDARRLSDDEAARVFYVSRDCRDVTAVRSFLRRYFGEQS